jgi:RimJ/RimL family protein N-acetyltransferase
MSAHPFATLAYARLFLAHAEPLWVEAWGTHVLARRIGESQSRDAIGCYPLTLFAEGADLAGGLAFLTAQGLVSVGLTPDPLTSPEAGALAEAFPLCVPFKYHLAVDYGRPLRWSKHHRYEVRRALASVSVEEVALADHLEGWLGLYRELSTRRAVGGLSAFSPEAFAALAGIEGLRTMAAFADGELASMHLWILDEARGVGHSLLAASSAEGYRLGAAYAVYDASIRRFDHLRRLHLGGGAGLRQDDTDGLFRFKQGFANDKVQALFCGAALDPERYAALSGGASPTSTPFPAYRFPAARPMRLRPLAAEDLPRLHRWYQTAELWDHLVGAHQVRTEAEAVGYMTGWLDRTDREVRLGVEAGGRLVGLVSLTAIGAVPGRAELHLFLGDAADRGRGLGRAAVEEMLRLAFGELALEGVDLEVLETNAAARRVYEASGFLPTGRRAEPTLKRGRAVEVLKMSIERGAYRATSGGT